jgi:transposase
MVQRRRFSAEYKRQAVAMLNVPGVSVCQIVAELGIGAAVLERWRRELHQQAEQAFPGHGRSRDEEVGHLRCHEGAGFLRVAATFFARASR